jgi:WD40 repeat protein
VFKVDTTNGRLMALHGSPVATASRGSLQALAFNPGGTVLGVANADGTVSLLSVNRSVTAATAPAAVIGSDPQMGRPPRIAFSPDGRMLAASAGLGAYVFSVDPPTQALTPVSGSPFSDGVQDLAFSGDGGRLALADVAFPAVPGAANSVSLFALTGGAPSPVTGSPFSTGTTNLAQLKFTTSGLVGNDFYFSPFAGIDGGAGSGVGFFSIDAATGRVSRIAGSPLYPDQSSGIVPVTLGPDGQMVAMLLHSGPSIVYRSAEGAWLGVQGVHVTTPSRGVPAMAFGPGNRMLAIREPDGVVMLTITRRPR